MDIKILGVCGSPVKKGNVELYLEELLKTAEEKGGVSTELITLQGKELRDCIHCNWCMRKQAEGKFCNQSDYMQELYPKLLACDALVLASPAYFLRITGRMANFLDRMRPLMEGNYYKNTMANKVGAAQVVAWFRNNGIETTAMSIIMPMIGLGMFVVAPPFEEGALGAGALSSEGGTGKFDPKERYGILKDEYGMKAMRSLAHKLVEKTRLIKLGLEAMKAQQENKPAAG